MLMREKKKMLKNYNNVKKPNYQNDSDTAE